MYKSVTTRILQVCNATNTEEKQNRGKLKSVTREKKTQQKKHTHEYIVIASDHGGD